MKKIIILLAGIVLAVYLGNSLIGNNSIKDSMSKVFKHQVEIQNNIP